MNFFKSKEEDPDPEKLIYNYCTNFPVPVWADESKFHTCKHCKCDIAKPHKHHCRLCGFLHCSQCTVKMHLPQVYDKKGKGTLQRVCLKCRDDCLEMRKKEQEEKDPKKKAWKSLDDMAPPSFMSENSAQEVEIWPPEWEDSSKFQECPKCKKKGGRSHNCRACGKLFCPDCTSKMPLPVYFDKKGKTGPMRVCDGCRYKIKSGAKLVEKPSKANMFKQNVSALASVAPVTASNSSSAEPVSQEVDMTMIIRWEGEFQNLARLQVRPSWNLHEIEQAFRRTNSQPQPYSYVFRNEVIPDVFFDIFTAKALGPDVYIRPKSLVPKVISVPAPTALQSNPASTSSTSPVLQSSPTADAPPAFNPFSRAASKPDEKKEEKPAEEKKPTSSFRPPGGFRPPQLK